MDTGVRTVRSDTSVELDYVARPLPDDLPGCEHPLAANHFSLTPLSSPFLAEENNHHDTFWWGGGEGGTK